MPETTELKNIVVCSDGTGNQGFKNRGTNVYKLFEAIDVHQQSGVKQFKVYDDGVGTQSSKYIGMLGLGIGFGLRKNVFELYEAIARAYHPGDQIYMFGFSRGAFTVRLLAGFVAECGIINIDKLGNDPEAKDLRARTRQAWSLYRQKYASYLERALFIKRPKNNQAKLEKFVSSTEAHVTNIRFLGVWDTVDAYGIPFDVVAESINKVIIRFKFMDNSLSPKVEYGRHALAIDDERKTFHPTMWAKDSDPHRIRQVWFPGSHSDVGGGYPKHGLSLLSLRWMVEEVKWIADNGNCTPGAAGQIQALQKAGLTWIDTDKTYFHTHSNSDDMMHNPRAGLAVYYRYCPRNINHICDKAGIDPVIHDSATRRIRSRTEDYAPRAVPMKFHEEVTGKPLTKVATDLHPPRPLYNICKPYIGLRRAVQYCLYTITVIFVGLAGAVEPDLFRKETLTFAGMHEIAKAAFEEYRLLTIGLLVSLLAIAISSWLLRCVITKKCKNFWDTHRKSL